MTEVLHSNVSNAFNVGGYMIEVGEGFRPVRVSDQGDIETTVIRNMKHV